MVGAPMVGHPQELIWVLHYLGRAPMVAREPIGWGGSLGAGVLTGSWIPPSEWDSRVGIHPVMGGGAPMDAHSTHRCPPSSSAPQGCTGASSGSWGRCAWGPPVGSPAPSAGGQHPPGGHPPSPSLPA